MQVNTRFEANKIRRAVQISGRQFVIRRSQLNDFGEPVPGDNVIGMIQGLYHEQNGNVQITTGDTTQVRTKKIPCILCAFGDNEAILALVRPDDRVTFNSKQYKITGVVDIQEWRIIADISLELIDDGS